MNYTGKTVFITGGSKGIGFALARQFSHLGASIWVMARSPQTLADAKAELEKTRLSPSQQIITIPCDISDRSAVEGALTPLIQQCGTPEILVNCAGITYPGEFINLDTEIFESMIRVNYLGAVYVTKQIVPGMVARKSGYIVNISSAAGYIGVYGYSAYGASKYALTGFSDVLRAELRLHNINMSIVFPPDTNTDQLKFETPLKPAITKSVASSAKVLTPEQVAQAVIKGMQKRHYIITPGTDNALLYFASKILVNGVYPIMDWMVAQAARNHNIKPS